MKLHKDDTANYILDSMISLAVNKLGFKQTSLEAHCSRIYYRTLQENTKKLGKFVYCTEYMIHEICHLLIEEQFETFKPGLRETHKRSFVGQINELQTVALSSILLESWFPTAETYRWSRNKRCAETFVWDVRERKNPKDILTTVEYMMPDNNLRRLASMFTVKINQAIDRSNLKHVSSFEF